MGSAPDVTLVIWFHWVLFALSSSAGSSQLSVVSKLCIKRHHFCSAFCYFVDNTKNNDLIFRQSFTLRSVCPNSFLKSELPTHHFAEQISFWLHFCIEFFVYDIFTDHHPILIRGLSVSLRMSVIFLVESLAHTQQSALRVSLSFTSVAHVYV